MDEHSHLPDRSMLNESGITIYADPTATDPFVHTCMPFNNVQDISRQGKCVMCMAVGRKKATSVRETDIHPSRHYYSMKGKYQCFHRHVAN